MSQKLKPIVHGFKCGWKETELSITRSYFKIQTLEFWVEKFLKFGIVLCLRCWSKTINQKT